MVEIQVPNREFKPSLGVELNEERVKQLKPSLFREVYRDLERVEKDGKN